MTKSILKLSLAGLLAVAVVEAPLQLCAQTNTNAPAATTGKKTTLPFRGKLSAVDKTAKTITVGERTFQITSDTKIFKAGKPATLEDGVVGEDMSGSYRKADDGKLTAVTVRFGPREGKGETKKDEPKQ
jgi:hypothetical protein